MLAIPREFDQHYGAARIAVRRGAFAPRAGSRLRPTWTAALLRFSPTRGFGSDSSGQSARTLVGEAPRRCMGGAPPARRTCAPGPFDRLLRGDLPRML
jgi:hypothetical protein